MNGKIKFKIKNATEAEILSHLFECNDNFTPSLDEKVNIPDYSKKIFEKSVTFEAWEGHHLVGLISAYFNNVETGGGYITSVSVVKGYEGKGIASELMNSCIDYARQNKFREIILEVSEGNLSAINLYKKFNFQKYENKRNLTLMRLGLSVEN